MKLISGMLPSWICGMQKQIWRPVKSSSQGIRKFIGFGMKSVKQANCVFLPTCSRVWTLAAKLFTCKRTVGRVVASYASRYCVASALQCTLQIRDSSISSCMKIPDINSPEIRRRISRPMNETSSLRQRKDRAPHHVITWHRHVTTKHPSRDQVTVGGGASSPPTITTTHASLHKAVTAYSRTRPKTWVHLLLPPRCFSLGCQWWWLQATRCVRCCPALLSPPFLASGTAPTRWSSSGTW